MDIGALGARWKGQTILLDKKLLRNFDYTLMITVLLIIAYGLVILSSATHITMGKGGDQFAFVKKQLSSVIIGLVFIGGLFTINYSDLAKYTKFFYVLNVILLIAVKIFGSTAKGAQSWIKLGPVNFQPSEVAKVLVIITFAAYLVNHQGKLNSFKDLIPSFVHFGIPMLLILAQPDLGTALVFTAIFFGMLFVAGANPKVLVAIIMAGAIMVGSVLYGQLALGWEKPLKQYQAKTLTVFADLYQDARGAGYHVIQSQVAIGSGGAWGKGLYRGTQNQLNFLPEQQTDFIFSVVGEELGFAGVSALLLLFFILVYRGIRIAADSRDMFGTLLATGIVSMIVFHLLVNIGMAAGIMPITGIPLPLFSYGGSSMMANLIAIGLLININLRRQKLMF